MLKFNILLLITMVGGCLQVSGQSIQVKTILEATKVCENREAFSDYLKSYDFCFHETHEEETFTYSTHFKCGQDTIGMEGLRVNFSVSNDGTLNSSFLTRNARKVKSYKRELKKYKFHQITEGSVDTSREHATWFVSEKFPGVTIMWEDLVDRQKRPLWHIGFIWNQS